MSLTDAEWQQARNELEDLHARDDAQGVFIASLKDLAEQIEEGELSLDDAKLALLVMAVD